MVKGWKLIPSDVIARIRASFVADLNLLVQFKELKFSFIPSFGLGCAVLETRRRTFPALSFLCPCLLTLAGGVPVSVAVFLPGNSDLSQAVTSDHHRDQNFC